LPAATATPELVLVGANHRTCPLDERETLLRRATYPRLRAAGGSPPPWTDLVLLTTCNRIEIYAVTTNPRETIRAVRKGLEVPDSSSWLYSLTGLEAAAHLLRVAAGLDSLAQGESQVAAQVRTAPSLRPRTLRRTPELAGVFERAAREAPRIRSLAGLDGKDISASHAALRFIEASVPVPHPTIALLGTGKMARIAAGSLRERATLLVANRDATRAREVAKGLGGKGYGLDHLDEVLAAADVVLAATATRKPLVSESRIRRVLARRAGRPLWFIDLGFPRNIDPASRALPGVTLVDIDALAPWGAQPLPPAAQARAEARIHAEARHLVDGLHPAATADIAALRRTAEAIRRREVDEALSRLPALSDSDRAVVDKLATRLVNRFLHGPTERLRSFPEATRVEIVQELLRGMGGTPR
jgi:glutamyl-tRNA reductase